MAATSNPESVAGVKSSHNWLEWWRYLCSYELVSTDEWYSFYCPTDSEFPNEWATRGKTLLPYLEPRAMRMLLLIQTSCWHTDVVNGWLADSGHTCFWSIHLFHTNPVKLVVWGKQVINKLDTNWWPTFPRQLKVCNTVGFHQEQVVGINEPTFEFLQSHVSS
jgi:hypothetical protein